MCCLNNFQTDKGTGENREARGHAERARTQKPTADGGE